jgi:luciferase family oxidoreductase group 1
VPSLSEVPLSVFDTSPIVQDSTARTALLNTLDLAQLADALGYHRYWVPEHHSMRGVASAAPAVVVGQLAAATRNIRVGAGGVLLPNHAPLVIAEQFGTLEAFHPGRIDLGIGRALGGTKHTAEFVRGSADRAAKDFTEQLTELLGYFESPKPEAIRAVPAVGNTPPVWLLGSSEFSAKLAASLGLAYAFAHHLNPVGAVDAIALYRDSFRPSSLRAGPRVLVSSTAIVAESDDQAQWLSGPTKRKFLGRRLGERILLPSPRDAAAYAYTADDLAAIDSRFTDVFIGSSETVGKGLQGLLDATTADELAITTPVYDHADRRRSYELLAELALAR